MKNIKDGKIPPVYVFKNEGYDVDAFCSFLAQEGFSLTVRTLQRYCKTAIVTNPARIAATYSNQNLRVAHHPFATIEAIVAILLFKGDWLVQDSAFRLPRLGAEDIKLGRTLFMLRGGADFLDQKCKEWKLVEFQPFLYTQMANEMLSAGFDEDGKLSDWYDMQLKHLASALQSSENAVLYAENMGMLYRRTFEALFEKYGEVVASNVLNRG